MYTDTHPEPTDPRIGRATVYLIVGLPGAGKTTHAKELEISASALRLTPDEWQINYAVKKRRAGKAPEGSGVLSAPSTTGTSSRTRTLRN